MATTAARRGSFTTAYVSCGRCFAVALDALQRLPGLEDYGMLGVRRLVGCYEGAFDDSSVRASLESTLCHPLAIVVASDDGEPVRLVFELRQQGS